jgi:hypothetical protein
MHNMIVVRIATSPWHGGDRRETAPRGSSSRGVKNERLLRDAAR